MSSFSSCSLCRCGELSRVLWPAEPTKPRGHGGGKTFDRMDRIYRGKRCQEPTSLFWFPGTFSPPFAPLQCLEPTTRAPIESPHPQRHDSVTDRSFLQSHSMVFTLSTAIQPLQNMSSRPVPPQRLYTSKNPMVIYGIRKALRPTCLRPALHCQLAPRFGCITEPPLAAWYSASTSCPSQQQAHCWFAV